MIWIRRCTVIWVCWLCLGGTLALAEEERVPTDSLYQRAVRLLPVDADSALVLARRVHAQRRANGAANECEALNLIGYAQLRQSDHAAAEATYLQTLRNARSVGNYACVAAAQTGLGVSYFYTGQLAPAAACYLRSAELYDSLQTRAKAASAYNNLGRLYLDMEDTELAMRYLHRSLAISTAVRSAHRRVAAMVNLADAYQQTARPDSARLLATAAAVLADSTDRPYTRGMVASLRARLALAHLTPGEALMHAARAERLLLGVGDTTAVQEVQLTRVGAYLLTDSLRTARRLLTNLLDAPAAPRVSVRAHQLAARLAVLEDDYVRAYAHQQTFQQLDRARTSTRTRGRIADVENRFKQRERAATVQVLRQRNTIQRLQLRQRTIALLGAVGLLVLVAGGFVLHNRQQRLRQMRKVQRLRDDLLQSQLNPHFLFNALTAIQGMIYTRQDPGRIADCLARFSALMRRIIQFNRVAEVTLAQEIAFVEAYLDVQRLRFDTPFEFTVGVDPALRPHAVRVPPLITQPFIERAVECGLSERAPRTGRVEVYFARGERGLEIRILDNGAAAAATEVRSASIELARRRLALLRPTADCLHVRAREAGPGTAVVLSLPLTLAS